VQGEYVDLRDKYKKVRSKYEDVQGKYRDLQTACKLVSLHRVFGWLDNNIDSAAGREAAYS
jgi:hypothetical protein